jgi:CHAT domain-containing protein/tetratricopeptide (TPR) repeat protein
MQKRAIGFFFLAAALIPEVTSPTPFLAAQTSQSETQQHVEDGPPEPSGTVKSVVNESGRQLQAQNAKEALMLADQALKLAVEGKDTVGEALAHKARADALGRLGAKPDQMSAYLAAAAAWQRAGDGPGEVEMLGEAGVRLVESGDENGKAQLRQALSLGRQETRRPLAAASALRTVSEHLLRLAKRTVLKEADEFSQAALDIQQRLVPDSVIVADSLYFRAWVSSDLGRPGASLEYLQRALAIQRRLAPDSPELGKTLRGLASLAIDQGDLTEARKYCLLALQLHEKAGSNWDYQKAATLQNLTRIAIRLRDLSAADEYSREAVAITERIDAGSIRHAVYIASWGMVAYAAGDWTRAEERYRTALAIAEKKDPGSLIAAQTLEALGRVMRIRRNLPSARDYTEQAVRLLEKTEDPDLMYALQSLALIVAEQGELLLAEQIGRRALSLQEKRHGEAHPLAAASLETLSYVLARQGRRTEAIELALEAERRAREHTRLMIQSLTEREALVFAAARASGLDHLLPLVATNPSRRGPAGRAAFDSLIRSRALVLDEMAMRHRTVHSGDDPETARLAAGMASTRTALAKLIVRGPGRTQEDYAKQLDRLWQHKEAAERALAEKSRSFGEGLVLTRAGIVELAQALPPGSAVVAFARFGGTVPPSAWPLVFPPRPSVAYMAFVLRSGDEEPAAIALGSATEIDGLVMKLRERIAQEEGAPGRAAMRNEAAYRTAAAALRKKIWDPIAPYLRGTQRVFIVPDGALHLVSFAALPTGHSSYLLETGPRIHYLSSERNLVPLGEQEKKGVGLLAIGAPAFQEASLFAALRPQEKEPEKAAPALVAGPTTFRGLRSTCDNFQAMQFEALSASAREVADVTAVWERPGGMLRGAEGNAVQLIGAAASESAFKQQAAGKRVLHLATHGFFLGGKCASALEATEKPGGEAAASLTGENPLVLSGLALAGANHRQAAGPDEEDGILTAEEIGALDLSGVEWAVLSACDTGVGEVKAGEGVLGLRRAFQVAGARTLIMSLWPVEDQVARDWMGQLYRARLVHGLTTIDAVHQANLKTLRQRRAKGLTTHPFYWAGFVAAGDWR